MAELEVGACFAAYEAALVAGDVEAMNEWFLDDERVIRFGIAEEQRGAAAIRRWRRSSASVPNGRALQGTEVVSWSGDIVVVTTEFHYPGRAALGRQSQTWLRTGAGWRIVHAHVSERLVEE